MLDLLRRVFQRRRLHPVSKALDVEAGVIKEQVLNAVAAVDQVHTDGVLPDLPVKAASLVDRYGYFQNTADGRAVEIVVSLLNPHVELTAAHEIGHFLDFQGLDRSTLWASVNSPTLAAWREAVKTSRAVQTLGHFRNPAIRTMAVTLWDGSVVEYPVDKIYVGYLLKAEELAGAQLLSVHRDQKPRPGASAPARAGAGSPRQRHLLSETLGRGRLSADPSRDGGHFSRSEVDAMSKKLTLGTLFHRPPTVGEPAKEQTGEAEKLDRELKAVEPETRFREALANGKITGDIITTDENGNVVRSAKSTNIFDL